MRSDCFKIKASSENFEQLDFLIRDAETSSKVKLFASKIVNETQIKVQFSDKFKKIGW